MANNNPYRILSLDGGGVWSLIQAKALLNFYGDVPGREVLKEFQLAAGTSGGSIVLGGLIENLTLGEIVSRFEDEAWRRKLFVDLPWYGKLTRVIGLGPRFSTEGKFAGLKEAFPNTADAPLSSVPGVVGGPAGAGPDILVTGFNYDRERGTFFRSNLSSRAASTAPATDVTVREAIHASSTAPINYFDVPAEYEKPPRRYWDGAVSGNNNPALVAVMEALANGVPRASIRVLSIGTGSVFLPLEDPVDNPKNVGSPLVQPRANPGLLTDLKKFAGGILDDPPDAATFVSHLTLGGRMPQRAREVVSDGPVVRMSPLVQPVLKDANFPPGGMEWVLPGGNLSAGTPRLTEAEFVALTNLDIAAIEPADVALIAKFCDQWLQNGITNQAIRMRSDSLACEIGQASFGQAKKAWMNA